MKKNKILFLLIFVAMSFCFTACQVSSKENQALKEQVPLAEAYYEEKYNCDIEIVEYSYDYYDYSDSTLREYDTNEMFFLTNEDTFILYSVYDEQFSDTRQENVICNRLQNSLIPQLMSYIKNPCYWDYATDYFYCNMEVVWDVDNKSFFHTYYDDDNWVEFFTTEMPTLYFDEPLYIISSESTQHEKIKEYIYELFSQFMDISRLEIIFLSEELYQKEPGYDIGGEDGFIASYRLMGSSTYTVIPKYIKIADGIYITSTNTNFQYDDEDFIVSEAMDLSEAISAYESAYRDAKENSETESIFEQTTTPYSFDTKNGYAYKIDFSDYYIKRTEDDFTSWYEFCLKIVPSELNEDVTSFYYFATCEEDYPNFEKCTVDVDTTTFYTYVRYPETADMYFCLGTE